MVAVMVCASAIFAGCHTMLVYEKGLPKRVDIQKSVGASGLRLVVEPVQGGVLEVALLRRSEIALRRKIVFNTVITEDVRSGSPLWKLLEIPLGLVTPLGFCPMAMVGFFDLPESPTVKPAHMSNRLGWCFSLLNPFASFFSKRIVRNFDNDEEVFTSTPKRTRYAVSLPVADQRVEVEVFDTNGTMVQRLRANTDHFGRVVMSGLAAGRFRVVARSGKVRSEVHVLSAKR